MIKRLRSNYDMSQVVLKNNQYMFPAPVMNWLKEKGAKQIQAEQPTIGTKFDKIDDDIRQLNGSVRLLVYQAFHRMSTICKTLENDNVICYD